ncbi:probable serine/threonine-protein kinase PBL1 [Olea europaea var. sylvestris]|uniref:probable serine/threonine-protein kinase PBL1 n=1 Tax=Olea europaea var. sylvestris TaxID=158386 RepID=UPI000C1D23A1|nr:probable serine/threonine-protein kinase PBL1 [Olea europaea var. sylvestris]
MYPYRIPVPESEHHRLARVHGMVNYLRRFHHPNVIKLIAYCTDGDNLLLSVYEQPFNIFLHCHICYLIIHDHEAFLNVTAFLVVASEKNSVNHYFKCLGTLDFSLPSLQVVLEPKWLLHFKLLPCLSWSTRIKVAVDTAGGLSFLHDAKNKVIHRHIKSSNILLDKDFNAKLSDFDLAKEMLPDHMTHIST